MNALIIKIRQYTPKIIITNSRMDRHPDHENASKFVKKGTFLSGLIKIKSKLNNANQNPWRPNIILYSIQNNFVDPDFVLDVSDYFQTKIKSIECFRSQFYDSKSKEPESFISSKGFMEFVNARSIDLGHSIGVAHGEGFTCDSKLKIDNLKNIL